MKKINLIASILAALILCSPIAESAGSLVAWQAGTAVRVSDGVSATITAMNVSRKPCIAQVVIWQAVSDEGKPIKPTTRPAQAMLVPGEQRMFTVNAHAEDATISRVQVRLTLAGKAQQPMEAVWLAVK